MATRPSKIQTDLNDALDTITRAKGILREAYTPEAAREEIAAAIGAALNVMEDYDDDDIDQEEEE